MGLGMWLIPILFIIIIFYIFNEKKDSKKEELSAQDLLDKRYAKGEIDEEEYEKKSKALKEHS